jgi:magnesium transporter
MNVADVAEFLETLEKSDLLKLFRLLPKEMGAEVFALFSPEAQLQIVQSITDKEIMFIIDELFLDDTIDFIEEMPSNVVKRVLKNTSPQTRKLINRFLNYPEDSAGSLMTVEYVSLEKSMTTGTALGQIRKTGVDKETINTCYVSSVSRVLEGAVSIRNIILADPNTKVADIMESNVISCQTTDDREHVAELFKKYDLSALPVVDTENRIVGIITVDDIIEVIEQEATEDIQKMAGTTPNDEEYLKTGIFTLAMHRIVWLLILMVSATVTSHIMAGYEQMLASSTVLMYFVPMLMGTGGNAGSQAATLIIRGLAVGEIHRTDFWRVWLKECSVGLITGVILGAVNYLKIFIFDNPVLHAAIPHNVMLTVSLSMATTVTIAKMFGGILPILAKFLKIDPAIMASPIISTCTDAISLLVFFNLSVAILGL